MPYRIKPSDKKCVQVKRGKTWRDLKCHPTTKRAKSHLAALNLNVSVSHR